MTKKGKIALKIIVSLVLIVAIVFGCLALVNVAGIKSNKNFINSVEPASYENQLEPALDENGRYTFVTDDEFKILQFSDVHIGAGFMSIKKDNLALNAVAAMVTAEKPDLVIVTGDITYPVPVQAGTFNNKENAKLFASLMERLGVYWCAALGNHDSESYAYFSRQEVGELYESGDYPHCLFQCGDESIDGVGNYTINIKNSNGEITQSLIMLDSHSYIKGNIPGVDWKYDCIHENQIAWYENEIKELTAENNGVTPKSLAFFHIPIQEMQTAYYEYRDNDFTDTEDVKYYYGETGEIDIVVYPSEKNYGFFDKAAELGSTQGMFFGHDHLNNISLEYKGIRLSYGCSIDYLAYKDIKNYGSQRGCTVITVMPDGNFDSYTENYYQDKYQPVNAKEQVSMEPYYSESE